MPRSKETTALLYLMPESIPVFMINDLEGQQEELKRRLRAEIPGLLFQPVGSRAFHPDVLNIVLQPGTYSQVRPKVERIVHDLVSERSHATARP